MMQSRRSNSDLVADKPQLVELVVDGRFLLDINIAGRNVSLGLVVVVIRDEVLDRVVRKEALELVIELRRQRLVVRQNEGRTVDLGDDLGHGKGLAGAGDAQQHLVLLALEQAARELRNRRDLIALRLILRLQLELHKTPAQPAGRPKDGSRRLGNP